MSSNGQESQPFRKWPSLPLMVNAEQELYDWCRERGVTMEFAEALFENVLRRFSHDALAFGENRDRQR